MFKPPGEAVNPRVIELEHGVMEKFDSTRKLTTFALADLAVGTYTKGIVIVDLNRITAIHFLGGVAESRAYRCQRIGYAQ